MSSQTTATAVKEPKKPWQNVPVWDTFTDYDGSIWQIKKDLDTGNVYPAKIAEPPAPLKPDTCSNRSIGFKSS